MRDVLLHGADDSQFERWDTILRMVPFASDDAQLRRVGHDGVVQGLLDFLQRFGNLQTVNVNGLGFWPQIVCCTQYQSAPFSQGCV